MKSAVISVALFCLWCIVLTLLGSTTAVAQNMDEVRQYDVFVSNKHVGNVTIRISQAPDGATSISTDTSIEAAFLFIKYRYEFHGNEKWHGDRLVQLDSKTNDNGTSLSVQALIDSKGSRINVPGKTNCVGPSLAMTENYWRLPDANLTAGIFSIIEPDTGILRAVQLHRLGPETVTVEGRAIACYHYRLTGEATAELWYDDQGRLVRQHTVEQGYSTEQRLARIPISRQAPTAAQALLMGYSN
jgi:hypothetical protein